MAMSGGSDDGSPMMEINTTPLIDVMLVLLIMFIITIRGYALVDIDLPAPAPQTNCAGRDKNKVVICWDDPWNASRSMRRSLPVDRNAT
jgi:biopolymer transport protein ExbD